MSGFRPTDFELTFFRMGGEPEDQTHPRTNGEHWLSDWDQWKKVLTMASFGQLVLRLAHPFKCKNQIPDLWLSDMGSVLAEASPGATSSSPTTSGTSAQD